MQSNTKNFHSHLADKIGANKHILMGYLFLSLVFAGAVSSVYYWEHKAEATRAAEQLSLPRNVGSGENASVSTDPEFCIQVVTRARNTVTGEVRDFPTPCELGGDWIPYNP